MLHLLYIIAFTILAVLAVGNLIRSLITVSFDTARISPASQWSNSTESNSYFGNNVISRRVPHPEFLDNTGKVIEEPLLVMRSMTVEDARQQLDALYKASPNYNGDTPNKHEE